MKRLILCLLAWSLLSIGTACSADQAVQRKLANELPRTLPKSPDATQLTFHLLDGFRLELLAAEPLVTDPVAVKYDEDGLAYVAEMGDYPYSDKSHDRPYQVQTSLPLGRIRILEDTNSDGRFDTSTVFADTLSWPTGLALWKGGVFVTATPDVLYLKDTDGDRKADVRRTVFTGFRKFNVQSVINNLQWGLDHRIYGAGSSNGGTIRTVDSDSEPVPMRSSDFRFGPIDTTFELVTGGARFGNTFDDWGNRFICDIRNPVQHVVLENRYLVRNPSLPVRTGLNDSAQSGGEVPVFRTSPPEPWRVINSQRLAANPDNTSPTSEKVAAGFLTSSSGITLYRGAAYPSKYYGNAFVGDVAGNLAMRYVLTPSGPSFDAAHVHGTFEFLASSDNWFRPVNFVNAPDGTLHVVDMYRETIEHPWSIPDDIKAYLDLVSGRDRGRIYRLVPPHYREGFKPPGPPRLGSVTMEELVAELENPNCWWRETAHRLIFERQDASAEVPLRRLLQESDKPAARLHALWSLSGLGLLTNSDLQLALADRSPHVRRHAVLLAEPLLRESPKLLALVLQAADDPDFSVRFQVAFTLGEVPDQRSTAALARITRRDGADSWMRTAVLSSISGSAASLLTDILADGEFSASSAGRAMIAQLSYVVGAGDRAGNPIENIRTVLAAVVGQEPNSPAHRRLQIDVVLGVGSGLKRAGHNLGESIADAASPEGRMVAEILTDARQMALNASADLQNRQKAIRLIGYGSFNATRQTALQLLDARQPHEIQIAAVDALCSFTHPEVAFVF